MSTPEGDAYVNPTAIVALGPSLAETFGGIVRSFRLLYLTGTTPLVVKDTPENIRAVFGVQGLPS